MSTDIVITTHNRRRLLKRTVAHIVKRTRTLYRLVLIDDGSKEGHALYARSLYDRGVVTKLVRREVPAGISANLRTLLEVTETDPLVFTDDDVLCPDVEPDWLMRLCVAMDARPDLGILALNDAQCALNHSRGELKPEGDVVLCRNVPGHFVMIRRAVLEAVTVLDGVRSPVKRLCVDAHRAGFEVGYLFDTWCQHIGASSVRWPVKDYGPELERVAPVDTRTLEPPDAYKE